MVAIGGGARRFDGGGWVAGVCTGDCGGHGGVVDLGYGVVFGGVGVVAV